MRFKLFDSSYRLLWFRLASIFSSCSLLVLASFSVANPSSQANSQLEFLLWFDRYAVNNNGDVIDPLDLDMLQQVKIDDDLAIKNDAIKSSSANITTLKKGEQQP